MGGISIHPPRVGRDGIRCPNVAVDGHFNPPSPCGEGRFWRVSSRAPLPFQSTLPVWGGTVGQLVHLRGQRYFNPPSPCGEGPLPHKASGRNPHFNPPSPCGEGLQAHLDCRCHDRISIHPPRVGRDMMSLLKVARAKAFQSTLPVWGGTDRIPRRNNRKGNFNPPSPCGEGHVVVQFFHADDLISIHPPRVGRDALRLVWPTISRLISIHPPRVGRDSKSSQKFFVNFCARR